MKHVFIINPMAGASNQTETTMQAINKLDVDKEIYITKGKKDATRYVKEYIESHIGEEIRFYACGGDGTLNEVASGAINHDINNISITVYPVGSGNDYIKIFGGRKAFMDLEKLTKAKTKAVDMFSINDGLGYSINVVNYGLDCNVVKIMEQIKRNKNTTNEKAYKKAVFKSIFKCRHNKGTTYINGEKMNNGEFLFCTIAHGQYVGGQFKCSPKSICNDGAYDFISIDPVSIFRVPFLIGPYTKGEHLDSKKFKKIMRYRRDDSPVIIDGPDDFCICLDGELLYGNHFEVKIIKKAIAFAYPNE
ncbi:MAG: diacylglycerol kinase family protein [Bacillales bacterium]|nr:diacylglycerol kinase family protein [Bacillales bacterium]